MMQAYFYSLVDRLMAGLQGNEVLLCTFGGEDSDFVRLNHHRVRQAGSVQQRSVSLDLIAGARHATGDCELEGHLDRDLSRLQALLQDLRAQRRYLPEDPYLYYATQVHSSEHGHTNPLPDSGEVIAQVMEVAKDLDLVGIWASGTLYRGFANSLGQRNWHSSTTFNLDWSCYHAQDKAVKNNLAGFHWDAERLAAKMAETREQLELMTRPPRTLERGRYRVYLAPVAVRDVVEMMCWGGFDLKSHRTAQTPLIKMVKEGKTLHPGITLVEDNTRGLAPRFTGSGFVQPDHVVLIESGHYQDCLVSPRSAKEYGAEVNSGAEYPKTLEMASGSLPRDEVLSQLDTGLYLNNLWYCNFSDRNNCQITGMTRFACFWVEGGVIQAPINVMRFDESVYALLGTHLVSLTEEQELMLDARTYEHRSTRSHRLPGALIGAMSFTL